MPFIDDQLPLSRVDFRGFASSIIDQPDAGHRTRSAIGNVMKTRAIVFGADTVTPAQSDEADRLVQIGLEAARLIARDAAVQLTPEQELGYEAVVRLNERPALIIRDDSFPEPPQRWQRLDRPFRRDIEAIIPSVGRIDMAAGPRREMIGTGFVVAPDLVMTNTHVVEVFADPAPDFSSWSIKAGAQPTIDFKEEHEIPKRKAFRIKEVVTAYDRTDSDRMKSFDLALLRVDPVSFDPPGIKLPEAVRLAAQAPAVAAEGGPIDPNAKDIYLIGYPWTDNEGVTPPAILSQIFGGILKVKRLQPGEFGGAFADWFSFAHDSATLGGNSGSFVADLSSGLIIGLHFRGKYRQNNYALQLWRLKDVDGVKGKGLNFTG